MPLQTRTLKIKVSAAGKGLTTESIGLETKVLPDAEALTLYRRLSYVIRSVLLKKKPKDGPIGREDALEYVAIARKEPIPSADIAVLDALQRLADTAPPSARLNELMDAAYNLGRLARFEAES